jgi:hypothetical protein
MMRCVSFELAIALMTVARPGTAQHYELRGGRWFDGRGFAAHRVVYVIDGRFTGDRPVRVDSTIDLSGRFIVAPYGEAHNHNIEDAPPATIAKYLEAGIFYVKDPTSSIEARANAVGVLNVPTSIDGVFAGPTFTSPGGHPSGLVRRNIARGAMTPGADTGGFMIPVHDSADFERRWRTFLATRQDFVKVMLLYSEHYAVAKDDPREFNWYGFDPALMPLLVQRAHAAGLRVTVHVETETDFRVAVSAGADEIAHLAGFRPKYDSLQSYRGDLSQYRISDADARLAARRGVVVVTTLGEGLSYLAKGDSSGLDSASRARVFAMDRANLRLLRAHGVRIAFGSDWFLENTVSEVMQLRTLGVFSDVELLRIWSIDTPRSIFPDRRIGCFERGCEASFLALAGDPLVDFQNTERILLRMKQGVILAP